MLDRKLSDLNLVGWVLLLIALAGAAIVAIPIGGWALHDIHRTTLRSWTYPICVALAVPGIGIAVGTFWLGERALARLGIATRRANPDGDDAGREEREEP